MTKKSAKKSQLDTAGKKSGAVKRPLRFAANEAEQGGNKVYVFKAKASILYDALSINRRVEKDKKDEGYQRVLSPSRVQAITRHIAQKKPIPTAIVVCFDSAVYNKRKSELEVPKGNDVGWVIDGQHRLAGAAMAARSGVDIDMAVVAFIGLTKNKQVEQFVTINREAKNVPTSLYLDLLGKLPNKSAADSAKERAADIATGLRRKETSPFFDRIVVTVAPKAGQVSLTNFVRKIAPLVSLDKGILGVYSELEQSGVISNYYEGLRQVFPKEFEDKASVFFKTVGFGALWNVFPTFFSLTLREQKGFEVKDVVAIFRRIDTFSFSSWKEFGTGTQAETLAGNDLRTAVLFAFNADDGTAGSLRV